MKTYIIVLESTREMVAKITPPLSPEDTPRLFDYTDKLENAMPMTFRECDRCWTLLRKNRVSSYIINSDGSPIVGRPIDTVIDRVLQVMENFKFDPGMSFRDVVETLKRNSMYQPPEYQRDFWISFVTLLTDRHEQICMVPGLSEAVSLVMSGDDELCRK